MDIGYNPDRFIKITRDIFKILQTKSSNIDITEAFTLYYLLALKADWRNKYITTGKILLYMLGKDKRCLNDVKALLNALKAAKLVDYVEADFKINDLIELQVNISEKNFTKIRCVNEEILYQDYPVNTLMVFALHCYLQLKREPGGKFTRITLETIANDLNIAETTVIKYLNFMEEFGLLYIKHGKYNPETNRKVSNQYMPRDFDAIKIGQPYKKAKLGKPDNQEEDPEFEVIYDPILLMEKIEKTVSKVLNNPDYCPALFIGDYANEIRSQNKIPIKNIEADTLEDIIDNYFGIAQLDRVYLILNLVGTLSETQQNKLLVFMENSKLPIILLSDYDNIIPALASRMNFVFKAPLGKMNTCSFLSTQALYGNLKRIEQFSSLNEDYRKNYIANKSPGNYVLQYLSGGRKKSDQAIDRLIDILSGGRTYIDLLADEFIVSNLEGWK